LWALIPCSLGLILQTPRQRRWQPKKAEDSISVRVSAVAHDVIRPPLRRVSIFYSHPAVGSLCQPGLNEKELSVSLHYTSEGRRKSLSLLRAFEVLWSSTGWQCELVRTLIFWSGLTRLYRATSRSRQHRALSTADWGSWSPVDPIHGLLHSQRPRSASRSWARRPGGSACNTLSSRTEGVTVGGEGRMSWLPKKRDLNWDLVAYGHDFEAFGRQAQRGRVQASFSMLHDALIGSPCSTAACSGFWSAILDVLVARYLRLLCPAPASRGARTTVSYEISHHGPHSKLCHSSLSAAGSAARHLGVIPPIDLP
jgi:hypothetical protein